MEARTGFENRLAAWLVHFYTASGVLAAFFGTLAVVNYRYREQELVYLLDNSDASAVVYEAGFAGAVARLRDACPKVRDWIEIDDGAPGNAFADPYEELASGPGGTTVRLVV